VGERDASAVEHWFLTADERGNPWARIDRGASDAGWSTGNQVEVLVDGAAYFTRLYEVLCSLRADDWVHFTDWEGDPDERLAGPGTELAKVLEDLAARGVHVRGLLWRSHPAQVNFSEQQNLALTKDVNRAGGEILLDERVRRGGSHHQKLFVVRRADGPDDDVAFVGGIDLCHGRHDDARHLGDPQAVELDDCYSERPPWHDVQLEVRGPAVAALADTFRERWEDPHPLDHHNPLRRVVRTFTRQPRHPDPLPPRRDEPAPRGPHAVQVLRTYPTKRPAYSFAPEGERSVARAYLKAFRRARRLVYLEDQYFWSERAAHALADALRTQPTLRLVVVVPRWPDRDGRVAGPAARIGRERATRIVERAGDDRVVVCDIENERGTPIYVHAKVCIVDDVWMMVGSDNMNRRSWTHDSELSCALLDGMIDGREPRDPAGLGDGARVLARDTRLRLWREHLGRTEATGDDDLVDPALAFATFQSTARALDRWYEDGARGERPPGRVRIHQPEHVPARHRWWAHTVSRVVNDPDGRPRAHRRANRY
jgi:phosphatidylserine/phosphatidylglycerophosphate/cardiolipin synthase-like enzyme